MAGTWMSIVEGFGGMRIKNGSIDIFHHKFQNNGSLILLKLILEEKF
jgi:trehalose/maltose hydrolase-like predicted phosphorylase